MKKVIIVCPSGASGGQEALHQLCSLINSNYCDVTAYMHYYGAGPKKVNQRFIHYNLNIVEKIEEGQKTIIIVPEIFAYLINKFKKSQVGIWWLSIDGYYTVKNTSRRTRLKELFGLLSWPVLDSMDTRVINFYQSEYAKLYLQNLGVRNLFSLSDFTKEEFVREEGDFVIEKRKNVVTYNPKKGLDITKYLMELYAEINWVPLIDLSPNEVKDLLSSTKVYIDFGSHPGKDRFPREAASSGVVVITNKTGSAGNAIDVPLLDEFKFADPVAEHSKVNELINNVFENYNYYLNKQLNYRIKIREERACFLSEIDFIVKNLIF